MCTILWIFFLHVPSALITFQPELPCVPRMHMCCIILEWQSKHTGVCCARQTVTVLLIFATPFFVQGSQQTSTTGATTLGRAISNFTSYVKHTVDPEDTFARLSLTYSVSVADIKRANKMYDTDPLFSRAELIIPVNDANRDAVSPDRIVGSECVLRSICRTSTCCTVLGTTRPLLSVSWTRSNIDPKANRQPFLFADTAVHDIGFVFRSTVSDCVLFATHIGKGLCWRYS